MIRFIKIFKCIIYFKRACNLLFYWTEVIVYVKEKVINGLATLQFPFHSSDENFYQINGLQRKLKNKLRCNY